MKQTGNSYVPMLFNTELILTVTRKKIFYPLETFHVNVRAVISLKFHYWILFFIKEMCEIKC